MSANLCHADVSPPQYGPCPVAENRTGGGGGLYSQNQYHNVFFTSFPSPLWNGDVKEGRKKVLVRTAEQQRADRSGVVQ